MKQKHTTKRAARRGPSKTMFDAFRRLPVVIRRQQGFRGPDAVEFDKKHSIAAIN